jgi:hypothetical protein
MGVASLDRSPAPSPFRLPRGTLADDRFRARPDASRRRRGCLESRHGSTAVDCRAAGQALAGATEPRVPTDERRSHPCRQAWAVLPLPTRRDRALRAGRTRRGDAGGIAATRAEAIRHALDGGDQPKPGARVDGEGVGGSLVRPAGNLFPNCSPLGRRRVTSFHAKGPQMLAFRSVGETGCEPATARPPPGYLMAGTAQARLEEASRR